MSDFNIPQRGSNAANQDPEYLKRKFRQYLRLQDILAREASDAKLNQRYSKTPQDAARWQARVYTVSKYQVVADLYIQRLTAPAGGAE